MRRGGRALGVGSIVATLFVSCARTSTPEQLATKSAAMVTSASPMLTPRADHTATRLLDGRVLVAGGQAPTDDAGGTSSLSVAELYDPSTGKWTATTSPMLNPHVDHGAALLPDGDVLVFAGNATSNATSTSELWNHATGTWSAGAATNVPRDLVTSAQLPDGRVVMIGGADASGNALSSVEVFTPSASAPHGGTWQLVAPTSVPRTLSTLTPINDHQLVAAGGLTADSTSYISTGEIYDINANVWVPVGNVMADTRGRATATLLSDGRVLIAGGYGSGGAEGFDASTAIFDPCTALFYADTTMSHPRDGHVAALLPNGEVMLAGGEPYTATGQPDDGDTTELWSVGNSDVDATPLDAFRFAATATPLLDGSVLIAGGYDGDTAVGISAIQASVDIFALGNDGDPCVVDAECYSAACAFSEGEGAGTCHGSATFDAGIADALPGPGACAVDVGVIDTSDGGNDATDDAPDAADGGPDATDGAFDVGDGATAALDSASDVVDGAPDVVDSATDAMDGASDVVDSATGAVDGGSDAVDGALGAVDGALGVVDSASDAVDGALSVVDSAFDADGASTPTVIRGAFQSCTLDSDCATKFCVDGVCCDSACASPCHSCALPETPGHCALAPLGIDPRGDCASSGACVQTCGGAGTCVQASAGTICEINHCTDPQHGVGVAVCSANAGSCDESAAVAFDCAPYACVKAFGACASTCKTTEDCASGANCLGGQCVVVTAAKPSGCAIGGAREDDDAQEGLQIVAAFGVLIVARRRRTRVARSARRSPADKKELSPRSDAGSSALRPSRA